MMASSREEDFERNNAFLLFEQYGHTLTQEPYIHAITTQNTLQLSYQIHGSNPYYFGHFEFSCAIFNICPQQSVVVVHEKCTPFHLIRK